MSGAAGSTKGFQALAPWIGGIFTGGVVAIGGWWWGMDIVMCGDGGFWERPTSREARLATPHRSRIHIRHICVLPFHVHVPPFRIESTLPGSPRRPVLVSSPSHSWVRYQPRIVLPASIHSARPSFSERKQHIRCLRHVAGRYVSRSEEGEQEGGRTSEGNRFLGKPHVVGQNIRRLPNDVPEFIPPSRSSPSGEGEQRAGRVNPRRTFTHPCPIPGPFPNSPSSFPGRGKHVAERRWFVGCGYPEDGCAHALATPRRNGRVNRLSQRRPSCRRCGQSHWPQPPACPDRDVRGQWLA